MRDTRYKSANRQGVKQTSSASSSASTSMEKSGPICWNCGEAGHVKRICPNPPYCSKCKQKGHLPVKYPLKGKRKETTQTLQKAQQTSVDQRFSNIRNKCIHCVSDHTSGTCPRRTLKPLQALQATQCIMVVLVQVRLSIILVTYHQCNHQTNFHHLLISQSHFHHHLLHPLTCLMHIQLLYQIFQQQSLL